MLIISSYLLLALISAPTSAIVIADGADSSPSNESPTSKSNQTATGDIGNSTFYYEANTFLLNSQQRTTANSNKNNDNGTGSGKLPFEAAGPQATSARNGRMLDLDALVGDFAASQAKRERERQLSGNRQSRYLQSSQQQQPTLDVGNGKKLHIQGFIPIVGVKDVTSQEHEDGSQPQDQTMSAALSELPGAQSSIGHASFVPNGGANIQRYLNAGEQQTQQVEAKFSGASVVETLKKPIRKLTGGGGGGEAGQQQQQNCLCVPFYMCKNGYVSESSLGKTQLQQMIAQQQQQAANSIQPPMLEMKSGQLIPSGQQQQQQPARPSNEPAQKEAQYADSYVPVDERSLDKEIITANPMMLGNLDDSNSEIQVNQSLTSEQPTTTATTNDSAPNDPLGANSTTESASDYSQDILGRMLGLKSGLMTKASSSLANPSGFTNPAGGAAGVCGLLRTCCNIPMHLYPSQQDLANEQLMASNQQLQKFQANKQALLGPQQMVMEQQAMQQLLQQQQQQQHQPQVLMGQRYPTTGMQQVNQLQRSQQQPIYGLPTNQQISHVRPPLEATSLAMAHRSSQFLQPSQPVATSNRYPSPQQFMRGAASMAQLQPLQSFQQMQSLHQQQQQQQQLPAALGSRKILDGRCGLRQAAGITGRVQSLQYPDSSADFGEYPAQAAILKRLGGSDSLFVCGGTLISQYWVATAAHCIKKHAQSELKVRLGEWDVHRDDEFYPFVEKEVRDIVVHPEFVAGNLVNDLALIRLSSPVDPSLPHVGPACLPSLDESFVRQRCWVTGWGKDSFGQKGSFQAVLREVELPVVSHNECEAGLRQTRLGPYYRLHSGFICAGGESGRDACEGDGGSGLYCVQPDGLVKVAGLVSWGIGCGQAGVPGVYVSLAHYRPWIENIISIDEDIYSPHHNLERSTNSTEQAPSA